MQRTLHEVLEILDLTGYYVFRPPVKGLNERFPTYVHSIDIPVNSGLILFFNKTRSAAAAVELPRRRTTVFFKPEGVKEATDRFIAQHAQTLLALGWSG